MIYTPIQYSTYTIYNSIRDEQTMTEIVASVRQIPHIETDTWFISLTNVIYLEYLTTRQMAATDMLYDFKITYLNWLMRTTLQEKIPRRCINTYFQAHIISSLNRRY